MGPNNRILLVEDNESISKLVEYKLSKDGYKIDVCSNGLAGLDAIKEHEYDLIILDVMMPGMSGFEILQEMRTMEHRKNAKVMMLTSKNREEDIARGFGLGVSEYMGKPFKVAELSM
ncbi:MAG TPA: response regulator [Bacteroidetes bacterium]|nr:response regulator [Bacteroidota bacterium]